MNERWSWIVRYAVVIAAALALGAAFGEMSLFKTTRLGRTGLSAANLVQFLTYGLALALLWLAARRAAPLLPAEDVRWNVLKSSACWLLKACPCARCWILMFPRRATARQFLTCWPSFHARFSPSLAPSW